MTALPLSRLRVLDLSRLLPGGFCSLLLADLGADVIKIEDTGMGDYVRWAPPYYGDDSKQSLGTRSALYLSLNRGKRSARIDLKSDDGRKAFLKLVEGADVVLESFRPGVLDRLGVGYETLREVNPRIIYCAITGYGLDGPNVARAGHDTNYLALNGLLGLTGAAGGPPVSAAGQIADLGGGGLMAAFGILAALAEREHSGEGQLVDVSMTDGALSWLGMVAAAYLADGRVPKRGEEMLNGGVACYLPYECADGWVSCGALEPKFWQAFCAGAERPDLVEHQFAKPGSEGHAAIAEVFKQRTKAEWGEFNDVHDCCIEPVLDLDEALDSKLVADREMVVELDQPEIGPVRLARPPGEVFAHARGSHEAGASARRAHGGGARRVRPLGGAHRSASRVRRRRRPQLQLRAGAVSLVSAPPQELLKISEIAERSDVPVATVRHYLREGLLPEPVKTSRNMAYYPPEFVDRIRLIKQLQEQRFMPLKVIRELLDSANGDHDRLRALAETGDALVERALGPEAERTSQAEILQRFDIPERALLRLAELGVLSPTEEGYSQTDVRIIEAVSNFRAAGWNETTGFGARDVARLMHGLEPVITDELRLLMERFSALGPERAGDIVEGGAAPFPALIGALHAKLLTAELERARANRP